jgi:hypothetical protein
VFSLLYQVNVSLLIRYFKGLGTFSSPLFRPHNFTLVVSNESGGGSGGETARRRRHMNYTRLKIDIVVYVCGPAFYLFLPVVDQRHLFTVVACI